MVKERLTKELLLAYGAVYKEVLQGPDLGQYQEGSVPKGGGPLQKTQMSGISRLQI